MTTEYGKRLREARKYAKLTQEGLASKTGIPQSTISTAERKGNGSAETPVYALACNVDSYWLGTGKGEMIPTLSAQLPSGEWTPHVNPSLRQASSGASAPATLQNALEFLAGYLSALDAGDRARAVRDIADLADEPQAVAKITARIEAMASPAFTDKKRSSG
ncbi:MAG: helix-turn-helix domain-containing protein [Rhodoferax sp.]|nr:helix-turn-helix domain-containing protein [Rhodoferax sp.]